MKPKNKILAGWIAFLFVLFHLSAIFIYAAPASYMPAPAKRFVNPYVTPLFEQTWSMFAPCPVVGGKMHVQLIYEDETTDWIEPTANDRRWHKYLRVTHHADLALLESNILYWVDYDVRDLGISYTDHVPEDLRALLKQGYSYLMLRRYVYRFGYIYKGEYPIAASVIMDVNNAESGVEGSVRFPEFKF